MTIDSFLRDRGMSEAQLAKLADTTGATINRLRHGKMQASPKLAKRLEEVTLGAISKAALRPDIWTAQ